MSHFARQIMNRQAVSEAEDVSPVSPPAARAALVKPRAWAEQFYREAEHTGLPLATLNRIVQECETHLAATVKVAEALAAGHGQAALRKSARADTAARLSTTHAKAHQSKRGATRH